MVINSFREIKKLRFNGRIVIAPRCIQLVRNNSFYKKLYIYIDNNYAYVWQCVENTSIYVPDYNNVLYYGRFKLYLNTKGLYFNLGLRYNHKPIKVYLCD